MGLGCIKEQIRRSRGKEEGRGKAREMKEGEEGWWREGEGMEWSGEAKNKWGGNGWHCRGERLREGRMGRDDEGEAECERRGGKGGA